MKLRRIICITLVFSVLISMTAFANNLAWENLPGHHNQSVLLGEEETTSQDVVVRNTRGEIISTGVTEITNMQNGELRVRIRTYAHNVVDRIHHVAAVDQWNEDRQVWDQVGFWEFEKTNEEAGGNLASFSMP